MLGRVVKPESTTYGSDYRHHHVNKVIAKNLSTQVTTGKHYTSTPATLYKTDIDIPAETHHYTRPQSAKQNLYRLPPEYASTVRPNLDPNPAQTNYQIYFGRCGEKAPVKHQLLTTSRQLSKTDQTDLEGTAKCTHYPPGYCGHIPREWKGNRGKYPRSNPDSEDITYQFHTQKTGYSGFVPKCENTMQTPRRLKHTSTTYRDMCAELGYTTVDDEYL